MLEDQNFCLNSQNYITLSSLDVESRLELCHVTAHKMTVKVAAVNSAEPDIHVSYALYGLQND